MIERNKTALAAALAMIGAAPLAAQTGWSSIGSGSLSGPAGRATLAAHGDPAYRQLMLCAEGHPVRLVDIVVTYADNHSQTIHDSERLANGACGRMLDLSSRRQAVTSVDVVFDAPSLADGTARIDLFAR